MPKNLHTMRDLGQSGMLAVMDILDSGQTPAGHTARDGAPTISHGHAVCRPARALADLAYFRSRGAWPDLRLSWVGGSDGLANALIEAAMYFPFELFMALPEWGEPNRDMLGLSLAAGAKIFLTRDPELAVDGANFIYRGHPRPLTAQGAALDGAAMLLSDDLLPLARPGVVVLPGLEKDEAALLPGEIMAIYRRVAAAMEAWAASAE